MKYPLPSPWYEFMNLFWDRKSWKHLRPFRYIYNNEQDYISGIKERLNVPLFSLMCLMNIQIWHHFLRKSSCAKKSIEGWCDGAIMMVRWRDHRTIVIASSHRRHCTVVLLRHRPKLELNNEIVNYVALCRFHYGFRISVV